MQKVKNRGLHLIADLSNCDFTKIENLSKEEIEESIYRAIRENDLTIVAGAFHYFNDKTSFTSTICLAESHIAIHTWPEYQHVSLDIFVCNIIKDKSENAMNTYKNLMEIFAARDEQLTLLHR